MDGMWFVIGFVLTIFVTGVLWFIVLPTFECIELCDQACNETYSGKNVGIGFTLTDVPFVCKCETSDAIEKLRIYQCEDEDGWEEMCRERERYCRWR